MTSTYRPPNDNSKISLFEFKSLAEERRYKKYVFSSPDDSCMHMSASFDEIAVAFSPNKIVLMGDTSQMVFNYIRYIIYITGDAQWWDKYIIVCKKFDGEGEERYTILADF